MRHRHLQYGISSPVAVLAAASQRTSRIELGTAVIPLGWENPLRLAEDLATVDILSGGRLNPGVSVGPPMHWDDVKDALYPDTADVEDFGYERVRAAAAACPRRAGDARSAGVEGIEVFSDRVSRTPRAWPAACGTAAPACARPQWAGEHGMNLLTSSVVKAEDRLGRRLDFAADPALATSAPFRAAPPRRRAARGCPRAWSSSPPTRATAEQRREVRGRTSQTSDPAHRAPQGPARLCSRPTWSAPRRRSPRRLYAHAAFREVDEVAFALPFSFEHDDYVQILTDIATKLGPALGWKAAA